jgi:prepilin signal peptidase PulO-like enzyme (type II secretory pathway)
MELAALLCIVIAVILLIILAYIDLKTYLLPNIFVAPFALLGIIFHIFTEFSYLTWEAVLIGGLGGYGLLWTIRFFGNKYYGQDSLGLGDVKLLGASGLWLGIEGVLFAMTLGAIAGLIHGLIYATHTKIKMQKPFNFRRLTIPAGPGFVIGILGVGGWIYKSFVLSIVYDLLS